jgi:hypothetical protein
MRTESLKKQLEYSYVNVSMRVTEKVLEELDTARREKESTTLEKASGNQHL